MIPTHSVLDVPVFQKLYDLHKLIHSYHPRIPKMSRYTLWQRCENTTLALLETLLETNYQRGAERLRTLYQMSNKLDLLKVFIRLSKETRIIEDKQYIEIQQILQEIGKIIGGWIKKVSTEL